MVHKADAGAFVGAEPERVLKTVFGYDSFRPFQKEIIASVLAGKDTLAVMPTGGGKSLCCQIPALIFDGLTIVVSPLIALMQDQVSALAENGVSAVFLNSTLEWDDYRKTSDDIRSGKVKLVYVSPEGLATERLKDLFCSDGVKVSCLTIDEAHCISEWGHDFRPDYLELASVRRLFSDAVCLALTATATASVRADIIKNLGMKRCEIFVAGFNRGNIFLEVRPKRNALGQVVHFIKNHPDESGIVYCFSRREVDELTHSLCDMGFSALNYHAGLSDSERASHQQSFIRDKTLIMVATVAFGMGIDKPNVRFVIHYSVPKSVEQYYQEIGRAGRDGLPAHALLLYGAEDVRKIRRFFDESDERKKSERLLQSMISYASSKTCLRRFLLSYFGEKGVSQDASLCCSVCAAGELPSVDVTLPSQMLLSCILRTRERFGASYVIDVLTGSRAKRIAENGHDSISTWGIGKNFPKSDWVALAEALIDAGYLHKSEDYRVLSLSQKAKRALTLREKIELPLSLGAFEAEEDGAAAVKSAASSYGAAASAFAHKAVKKSLPSKVVDQNDGEAIRIARELKAWRKKIAEEENVPPYVIFGDRTIADIAVKKPVNGAELSRVYGIGSVKAERFGSAIIRIVKNE